MLPVGGEVQSRAHLAQCADSGIERRAVRAVRGSLRESSRRLAVVVVLGALSVLPVVADVRAAKPGELLYAKRIGSRQASALGCAVAGGPGGATAVAGTQALRGADRPMVAKYSNTGKRVWRRRYARVAEGEVADVAFDRTGDIYAAASFSARSGRDGILILKYGPRGGLRWARSHRAAFAQTYEAAKLVVDRRGGVIVLGTSEDGWDGPSGVVVLKYRKNGERVWGPVRCDLDPGYHRSSADLALAVDHAGDIYVAGSAWAAGRENAVILKIDGADGTERIRRLYEPRNGDSSSFHHLTVHGSGLAATGSVWTEDSATSEGGLIVKFDLDLQEECRREWGAGNATEEAVTGLVVDRGGDVFVTGARWRAEGPGRVVIMRLNGGLSKVLWKRIYRPARGGAGGWHLVRDRSGDLWVGGLASGAGAPDRFIVLEYSPSGALRWVRTWSGGGDVYPVGLLVGTRGGVYIGGSVKDGRGVSRAVLLKYRR